MQPAWNQPTAPQPRQRPKWLTGWRLALTGTLAVLVLCCGGLTVVGLVTDDPAAKKTPEQAATAAPLIPPVAATPAETTPTPTPTLTTIPPTTTPSKTTAKATPKKTTATPKPKPSTKRPKPKPTRTTRPPSQSGVHPGAFCSPEGARGRTSKGTAMRCSRKAGDERARWRAA